jgi:Protein of unknown function (DUF3667)
MSDLEAILETGAAAGVELAASKLAGSGQPPDKCPNCGVTMTGPYCHMCGQEADTHRRSIWSLFHDLVDVVTNLDSRILRTVIALVAEPGELPCAFREGRTRRYIPPLRLYFVVSLIFFLVLGLGHIAILQLQVVGSVEKLQYDSQGNAYLPNPAYDPGDPDTKFMPKRIPIPKDEISKSGMHYSFGTRPYFFAPIGSHPSKLTADELHQLREKRANVVVNVATGPGQAKKVAEAKKIGGWVETHIFAGFRRVAANPAALNGPLTTWIPRVLFLLLPLYALLLAAFYWRQRKNFYLVDHLVFSLSVHTFAFVALIAAVGLAQILSGGWVFLFLLVAIGAYVLLSLRRFYEQGWFMTGVKFVFISGIYTVFFLLPALGGIVTYSFIST